MQETQEMQVWSLGQEDPLEKEMATTPVFLPEKSHGQRNVAGYSPWGHKALNMAEQLSIQLPKCPVSVWFHLSNVEIFQSFIWQAFITNLQHAYNYL